MHQPFRIFYTFFFIALLTGRLLAQQTSLPIQVQTANGQSYTDVVQTRSANDITLVSASDMATVLKLKPVYDALAKHLTVTASQAELGLWANNHFATVSNKRLGSLETMQLLVAPLAEGSTFFIPTDAAVRLFAKLLPNSEIKFDAGKFAVKLSEPVISANPVVQEPAAETLDTRYTIPKIDLDTKANGVVLKIFSTKPKLKYDFLRPTEDGFASVTFLNATGNVDALTKSFDKSIIKSVTARQVKGSLQISFQLDVKKYAVKTVEFSPEAGTNNFTLLVLADADVAKIYKNEHDRTISQQLESEKNKWNLDVIALDAGHGGIDPGTHGPRGTLEKDVAFSIVKKLGRLLRDNFPSMKIVYTRDTDVKIPLDERGKIANRAKAKLFVSVHCNANPNRDQNGVETYFLGLHKTDAALDVAKRENAVIQNEDDYQNRYQDFTDENVIMITLAQSAFSQQSQKLAELVNKNITARTDEAGRGVKQAGFMVLWTPSMPSILVESGFLTNAEEEKFLASDKGQQKIAEAIFAAIKKYKSEYESQP
jgi:N-acetylmuramoyl-L-alanine amidase